MFSKEELQILGKLNNPSKIQNFLNGLKINFEETGDTCMSPRKVLKEGKAQCMEGAIFAASVLRLLGHRPLVVDLEANKHDYDHVVAVFQKNGHWGSLSKTNHAVLRYREPVYRTIRELVMSFFHEYFLSSNGKKTLRRFSLPVDLSRFDYLKWMISDDDLWYIPDHLTKVRHFDVLNKSQIQTLRKADDIEISAGKILEYNMPEGFVDSLHE